VQWFFILSTIIKTGTEVGIKFLHENATEGINVGHGFGIVEGHLPSLIIQVYAHLIEFISKFHTARRQIQCL
jgi:hypothetical protein